MQRFAKLKSIRSAERRYNAGETVYLLPCRCGPYGLWARPFGISLHDDSQKLDWNRDSFRQRVLWFRFYNCIPELGGYVHFYVEEQIK